MKIIIAGGTGQIGTFLADHFQQNRHQVIVLSRRVQKARWQIVRWDGKTIGKWAQELDGADVLINLAGRSVNCRYHATNRKLIKQSRIESTDVLGKAVSQAKRPPHTWLQASTATIYAHRYDAPNDENSGIIGGLEDDVPESWRFSIDVAQSWEATFDRVKVPATRKVLLRSAMVMSPHPRGVFDTFLALVRFGLGGRMGNGRQYVSWIHYHDFTRAIEWLIEETNVIGTVNLSSPNPLPNRLFMQQLRHAWGSHFGLASVQWMLELGTFLLQTETELILKSRRVIPSRLIRQGFKFEYAQWEDAAKALCSEWQQSRQ